MRPGRAPAGHHHRAPQASRTTSARSRSRRWSRSSRRSSASRSSALFLEFDASRSPPPRSARCTARCCRTGERVAVKVQRPGAPRQIEADLALLYQAARLAARARARARLHRHAGARRRVRARDPRRSSTTASRRATRRASAATSPATSGSPSRRCTGATRAGGCSRSSSWTASGSPRSWTIGLSHRRAPRARPPHGRDVDDDDLPPRVLPRRPASREHPRPRRRRRDRARRLRRSSAGSTTTTCRRLTRMFIDAAPENRALPRRLAELGVRYPKEREEELAAELRATLLPLLRRAALAEIDPLQVMREVFELIYSMNLQLPTRFVAARQGDRDARRRSASSSTRTSTSSRSRGRMRAG